MASVIPVAANGQTQGTSSASGGEPRVYAPSPPPTPQASPRDSGEGGKGGSTSGSGRAMQELEIGKYPRKRLMLRHQMCLLCQSPQGTLQDRLTTGRCLSVCKPRMLRISICTCTQIISLVRSLITCLHTSRLLHKSTGNMAMVRKSRETTAQCNITGRVL